MDRRHELENLRRSLAMLNPGATASLSREEAIRLITEVAELQARLERLRVVWVNWSKSRRSDARTSEKPATESRWCFAARPPGRHKRAPATVWGSSPVPATGWRLDARSP